MLKPALLYPGLLVLVSLFVFVMCGGFLSKYYYLWQGGYFSTPTIATRGDYLFGLLLLLVSTWTANWAWKEIQRVKMGKVE